MKTGIWAVGIVCLIFVSGVFAYSGGSGKSNNPYQIASRADLLALGATTEDYGKCFILTADIDLDPNLPGGQVFTTAIIAPNTNNSMGFGGTAFTGTFDGNGHKITDLTINGGSNSYLGLFGYSNGSSVKNIGLENCSVSGNSNSSFVGGLVGHNNGNISNCYSTGSVSSYSYVGGLVGADVGEVNIAHCYSTSKVGGYSGIGGLVGDNSDGDITNCYSTGSVDGSASIGGLVGDNSNGDITNCYSTGSVNGSSFVGGFVGENWGNISNCYSTGTVKCSFESQNIGGFVGSNGGSISNCYSTGSAGDFVIGGLVGINDESYGGSVVRSFWDTLTSGQTSSAGGTGKATAEMQTLATFTDAGWDFVDETDNGTADIWKMPFAGGYPLLSWQDDTRSLLPRSQVKKCSITAGRTYASDKISFSGIMNATATEILMASEIVVTVDSADMVDPCIMTFPINATTYKKGLYKYILKTGALQSSFKLSTKTGMFSFSAKNVDLTGLACPVTATIQIGSYSTQMVLTEDIVNGTKKLCPYQLMMGVQDMLTADKVSVKRSSKPSSDSLKVSGRFTTDGEPNLANPMVITVGSQTLTVLRNQFLSNNGVESCKNAVSNEGPFVTARLDYVKCTFTLSVKNTCITQHGIADFGIDCFGESLNGLETIDLGL